MMNNIVLLQLYVNNCLRHLLTCLILLQEHIVSHMLIIATGKIGIHILKPPKWHSWPCWSVGQVMITILYMVYIIHHTLQDWSTCHSPAWLQQYLRCYHWLILLYRLPLNPLLWLVHYLPHPQKGLLEVFFDVFQIRLPEWTECFIQVLKSVGKCMYLTVSC